MNRVIIVGSPRTNGRSAHLAEMLFEANIDERPEDELYLVPVSEIEVGPCIGCGACRAKSEVILRDDEGNELSEMRHRCIYDDDMQTLYDLLDDADELTIVSPVYFSGAPAPMKCVLDRLQPYFWASREVALEERLAAKRPATLHVVGEGSDPHGYEALVSEVRSATAVAGFRLERVLDWVGKIDADGEITAEAEVVQDGAAAEAGGGDAAQGDKATAGQKKPRPKLDLSSGQKDKRQTDQREGQPARKQGGQQAKQQGKQSGRPQEKRRGKAQGTQPGKGKRRG